MKATTSLHDLGQSLWLDNITRELLQSGTLKRYIDEFSVTGLTSNPTIFDNAIKSSSSYDADIATKVKEGKAGEALFFELALADLAAAADLFRPTWDRTSGVDGWVSLEVSPLLAYDTASTIAAAKMLHARAGRPNLFIKIPGTKEGLPAIEESIFAGIPINVTLLFSHTQYLAAAEAYVRGIERRIAAGLKPEVASVASVFISRWDVSVAKQLGDSCAISSASPSPCRPTRRTASSSTHHAGSASSISVPGRSACCGRAQARRIRRRRRLLYVDALAAPFTVNTIPEGTLKALAALEDTRQNMRADGGDSAEALKRFAEAGVDVAALATQLQEEGAKSFVASWRGLMDVIASKSESLHQAR